MHMLVAIVSYAMLLIFGVLVSVNFAGIEKSIKNNIAICLLIFSNLIIQIACWHFFGFKLTSELYPLIVHLPLLLFIVFYMKKPFQLALVSVLVAYLCCEIPNWIGYLALSLFKIKISYFIGKIIAFIPILYVILRYIAPSGYNVMIDSKKSLYLFGSLPCLYYLFDYTTIIYTSLLINDKKVIMELFPLSVSIFYLIFVMVYYNEMQKRNKVKLENIMLSMQTEQAKNEINSLREIQRQTYIYRHDIRHHLSMINGYISNNNLEKAINYINQAQSDINAITPVCYCDNTTVNLILSSFCTKAKANDILFTANIECPKEIKVSETDLCSLFSNGLDNAMIAASKIKEKNNRTVNINCKTHKSNLLILIENSFCENIILENGLPTSTINEHGFGVKSIVAITKKYDGYSSFEPKDGIFTLRIVLPL